MIIKCTVWALNYPTAISIKKNSFYQMLLGALNVYKKHGSFTYDALGIYSAPTMMWTKNRPKCLAFLSNRNAFVRENQTQCLSFKLYTCH